MKNNLLLILMGILFFTYITPTYAIISHRAYYKVTLLSVNPDSEILDANGEMVIEMEDVCDGWTIEQKSWTNILLKTQPAAHYSSALFDQFGQIRATYGLARSF